MRILFKILLFPVELVLGIVVAVCRFLCYFSSALLSILSFLIFGLALALLIFGEADKIEFLKMLVFSFLISPFGLPALALLLTECLNAFNTTLKSI